MMRYAVFLLSLGVLGMLSLVSCGAGEDTAVLNTQTPVTTPTTLAAVPTATPPPTATTEATPLPTATATQTPVVTLTPLPTLAPDELETAVADLLANPMNCDVPCWWGAVPGETTVNDIKHDLIPYNFDTHEYYDEHEQVHLRIRSGILEEQNGYEINIAYAFSDTILKIGLLTM